MSYIEKYRSVSRQEYDMRKSIDEAVNKYMKDNYPTGYKKGEIDPDDIGWNILSDDIIEISYSVFLDNYQDYHSEEKYMQVTSSELEDYLK